MTYICSSFSGLTSRSLFTTSSLLNKNQTSIKREYFLPGVFSFWSRDKKCREYLKFPQKTQIFLILTCFHWDVNFYKGLRLCSFEMIRDHLDHGASKEPVNPCSEWIRRLLDHWSFFGSLQRNAPLMYSKSDYSFAYSVLKILELHVN